MRIPFVFSVVLISLSTASIAYADPAEMKRQADEAYDAHRYDDAARSYEAAYAEKKDPSVLYNLARTYEALGRHPEALDRLQRFNDFAPFEIRKKVPKLDGLLAVYRTRVATMEITSNVSGARIIVRNVIVGETKSETTKLKVNAGSATIEVSKDGYESWSRTLTLEGAAVTAIDAKLEAKGSAPAASVSPVASTPATEPSPAIYQRWWFWVGTGAAALVLTSVILLVAFSSEESPPRGTYGSGNLPATRSLVTF